MGFTDDQSSVREKEGQERRDGDHLGKREKKGKEMRVKEKREKRK